MWLARLGNVDMELVHHLPTNADTVKMEPFSHKIGLAEQQVNAHVSDLSEAVSVLSTPIRRTEVTD